METTITIDAFGYQYEFTDQFNEFDRATIEEAAHITIVSGSDENIERFLEFISPALYDYYWSDEGECLLFSDEEMEASLVLIAETFSLAVDQDERIWFDDEEAA